ncbi:hypothetical protein [Fusobacterium sp. SYSU M8D902]|uniref:hypothetical protein n=1 Tax=Fusobacterium sp. SYSU M8D902 TaxID=3159562 RepID=UPI0032E4CB9A
MELISFFKEYEENIEVIEVIGENYYYICKNLNKVILDEGRIKIDNLTIELEGFLQIKEEINNEQKIYIYLYNDFAIKFTMKKIVKLIDLLRYRKSDIQKIEIIGDNFYFPCTNSSNIIIKEDSNPIMLSIDRFITTFEREELLKGVLEQKDNIYTYNYKNFELKITMNKIIKPIKIVNPWKELKNILKL